MTPSVAHRSSTGPYKAAIASTLRGGFLFSLAGALTGFLYLTTAGALAGDFSFDLGLSAFAALMGCAFAAHSGIWAGLIHHLTLGPRSRLATALAAALANPFLWMAPEGYDGPFNWPEVIGTTVLVWLPFLCGWGYAAWADHTGGKPDSDPTWLKSRKRVAAIAAVSLATGYAVMAALILVGVAVMAFIRSSLPPGID